MRVGLVRDKYWTASSQLWICCPNDGIFYFVRVESRWVFFDELFKLLDELDGLNSRLSDVQVVIKQLCDHEIVSTPKFIAFDGRHY